METAARVATDGTLEGGSSGSRVGSLPYAKVRETAISRALGSEVTLAACADGETRFPAVRHGATVRVENPSVHSGVRPWNGRAREGFLRGRHVRSTCRRSVRPAIHVPSRGSPRSSSTGEPSDPPFGALHSEFDARQTRVPSIFPTKLGKSRTTEGDASCEDGASLRPERRRPLGARIYEQNVNDPSAGSPTDTLLRLLLPLNGRARRSFRPTRRETQGVVVKADRSEGLARSFNR